MSGGSLYRRILQEARHLKLPQDASDDARAALTATHEGTRQLLYSYALAATEDHAEAVTRGASMLCIFTAANLADDIADGDCDYLSDVRHGPSIQFLMQSMAHGVSHIPAKSAQALVSAASAHHIEHRLEGISVAEYLSIAELMGGNQWGAYLLSMWQGTPFEEDAFELGFKLGFSFFLAEDARSGDSRYTALPNEDKRLLWATANSFVQAIEESGITCLIRTTKALQSEASWGTV